MTKTTNILSLSALALIGAVFVLPTLSSDANASATSKLLNCNFDSKQQVVDCCKRVLQTEKKPYWLHDAGGSCGAVSICVPVKQTRRFVATHLAAPPKRKCLIKIPSENAEIKGGTGPKGTRRTTPNIRPNGGKN